MEVLSADNVKAYIRSKKFRYEELPVETAMCNYFKGWGKFSNNALGIPPTFVFRMEQGRVHIFISMYHIPDGGHGRKRCREVLARLVLSDPCRIR
jgi:hypothetical protein